MSSSVSRSICRGSSHLSDCVCLSVCLSVRQTDRQTVIYQSISHSVSQSVSQAVNWSVCHSVCQSVRSVSQSVSQESLAFELSQVITMTAVFCCSRVIHDGYSCVQIYSHLAPNWSIGHQQFSSTALCPELVVQFGSIASLFAGVLVQLIFTNCLRPTTVSFALSSRRVLVLVTLLCGLFV